MIRANRQGRYGVVASLILLSAAALLLAISVACRESDETEQASTSSSAAETPSENEAAPVSQADRAVAREASQTTEPEDDTPPSPPATEMTEASRPREEREATEPASVSLQLPSTVERIREYGGLRCGVKLTQPLFGYRNPDGSITGFDIDFCKAIQAALGEAIGLKLIDASDAATRFEGLLNDEFDVLIRTTTHTASRDRALGLEFTTPIFHSGLGFAVRRDSGIREIAHIGHRTICVPAGAVVSRILAEHFAALELPYTEIALDFPDHYDAFFDGRCEVLAGDVSALASAISVRPNARDFTILPQFISKEPIAIVVREDDPEWADLVNWIVHGLIMAEEFGITRENVPIFTDPPPSPVIARLLGLSYEGISVESLGFDSVGPQFILRAIEAVGNYGEIYERHLGGVLDRHCTLNALASEDKSDCPPGSGGVLYAHPYR